MAYLALYRRFRPDTFEKLVGQEHITKTLTNQIKNDRIGHAYLFCGSRGTGKTSAAKIFAKAVNCEHPQNGSPCNKCNTCKALSDPSNIDVLEIDAASNNRVDEIRDLRDKVMYPPVSGKFKVYIVDEVHMLTDSAFNALLKTLEEPPRHAIFILATTEVQKLPATILSRCMRFDFRLVSAEKIANLLKAIFDDIKKGYEEEAVTLIARAGEGSVRDALSLADMCVSYSDGKLTYDDVLEVIGASDKGKIYELADGILKGDLSLSVTLTDGLLNLGKGVGVLNRDLINHFRDLCVIRVSADAKKLLGVPDRIFEKLQTSSKICSMDKILRCLEIFSKTETELRFAVHPRVLFETAVFKAARPDSDYDKTQLLTRIAELEKKMANGAVFSAPQPAKPQEAVLKREEIQEKKPEKTAVTPPPPAYTEREEERQEENTSDIFQKSRQPSTGVDAKRVWGVVLRTVRQTNFMLFPVCRDLTAEIRNGLFTILTNNEQEAKVLNLPANYKTIKDILEKEGHSSFVITDKGKQAETKSPDQKFDELKELLGDKLKFQ